MSATKNLEYKLDRKKLSGIYVLIKEDVVVYVGQAANIYDRLETYHYGFGNVEIYCAECSDLEQRREIERRLIEKYKPKYNCPDFLELQQLVNLVTLRELESL